jgi:hypothetical protein
VQRSGPFLEPRRLRGVSCFWLRRNFSATARTLVPRLVLCDTLRMVMDYEADEAQPEKDPISTVRRRPGMFFGSTDG